MKRLKLFEAFVSEHLSTEGMPFAEIKKIKDTLNSTGGFKMYVGNDKDVTDFLRNMSSPTSPWAERVSNTQVKVYETPDDDAKHEMLDLLGNFNLNQVDLNSLNKN
jgi:hypothetical protein